MVLFKFCILDYQLYFFMRFFFIIIWFSLYFNLTAQTQNQDIPTEYIGNWYNPRTNEWNYGIFEKFAIINGKQFFYEKLIASKKGLNLIFQDKKIKPLVLKGDSSQLLIGKINYKKVDKFLPEYTGVDTTSFYSSKFQKVDTAYISGYLRNNKSNNPFTVGVTNWLTGEQESFYGDIDEYGFFTIKVPLYNTSQASIDWGRASLIDVLTPGEKYFLFKDLAKGETVFRGDNERLHNELVKYANYTSKNNINPNTREALQAKNKHERSLKDTSFLNLKLAQLDSLRKIDVDYMNKSNLSSRSEYFINKQTKYKTASSLMQKKFQLDYQSQEKFSDEYMKILKQHFFDKNVKPISLVSANYSFLRDYLNYYSTQRFPQLGEVLIKMDEFGEVKLTDSIKMYAVALSKMINSTGNIDLVSLEKIYPSINKRFQDIVNENKALIEPYVYLQAMIINPLGDYNKIVDSSVAELFHTRNIFQEFKARPNPIHPKFFEQLIASYTNSYLKNVVIAEHERLKKVAAGKLKYAENLKNTDHLKEAKDTDKIIAEILTPHKGKVVYMDFWGTWCAPCVAEMAYAESTKMALKDKEVVFIYMANNTSEEAWENFIKLKNLEGENVFHYNLPPEQESMIERRLGVNGFPTYMLFDKEGKLVNNQAPRPSELELLMHEIDKLL